MGAHGEALPASRNLCDELLKQLATLIPNVQRSHSQVWCAFFQANRPRFAYLSHKKTLQGVEIWCAGAPQDLKKNANGLVVRPRTHTAKGWEARFPARFDLDSVKDVPKAATLLHQVSWTSV